MPNVSSHVLWELMQSLGKKLLNNLCNTEPVNKHLAASVREEWLYGLIIRALFEGSSPLLKRRDFLITESYATRTSDTKKGHGKPDFIFSYKKWLIVMEVKAMGMSLSLGPVDVAKAKWCDKNTSACQQLISLKKSKQGSLKAIANDDSLGLKGVLFLPMLVVTYNVKGPSKESLRKMRKEEIIKKHDHVFAQLQGSKKHKCEYAKCDISGPSETLKAVRKKKSGPSQFQRILGYGVFAISSNF